MRIDPNEQFQQTTEYENALNEWLAANCTQCRDGCDEWFDAPEDLLNGCCHHCSALAQQRSQEIDDANDCFKCSEDENCECDKCFEVNKNDIA